jgi:FkbM family methyltransferase
MNLLKKIIRSTFLYKIYKNYRIFKHSVSRFLSAGDIVFDIGAHTGDKSEFFLKKGLKVIMVEPQPLCLEFLYKKFSNNPLAIIVGKGVSDKIGSLQLKINDKNPVLSTFASNWNAGRFKDEEWNRMLEVNTTTLDALILDYGNPKYIKIDVEGHEFSVIKGLTKKSGIVSFEFVEEFFYEAEKCISYLQSIGYKAFNFSLYEESKFYLEWADSHSFIKILNNLIKEKSNNSKKIWGDIYSR